MQPLSFYNSTDSSLFAKLMRKSFCSIAITLASTLTVTLFCQSISSQAQASIILQDSNTASNYRQNSNIPKGVNLDKLSRISPKRITHILNGDATGGGHGPGRGIPGKSEFPARWSDRQVIRYISDMIKDPNSRWIKQPGRPPNRWRIEGTREGVNIRIIVEPQGEGVITAFPTNRPRNP
ncbi:EndoU domain-containing protein [Phormidium sp. LEGE 05292]|uniref:EndoU domain-containing protein n=1 Tax=[Phormidium] sp. LEGE 05292 TaxID=767427 RepID=UPI00187E3D77|nr:EndoU domain-containing protein [Phormidium sp. LEGE 05292]MBE9228795.1 EndoU domain-containing protein [Phormidium sp. LEGE 05292]